MTPLILAAALVAAGGPQAARPQAIAPIALHPGVNTIPRFTADGRSAAIVVAWRENGNAHGYNTFMVLAPRRAGAPDQIVGIEKPHGLEDLLRDNPFDGERRLGVVRFARASLDGRRQTVLITADLNDAPSGVLGDHATATVQVYRLVHEETVGATPDRFELAWSATTDKRYCNVEFALNDVLGLALGTDAASSKTRDGC